MERYKRQLLLSEIGEKGQEKLKNSSVLIIGLGGLGCPVSLYISGAGVGRIGLCDKDKVELHNLHRQTLYDETQVGQNKVEAAYKRLSKLNSSVKFELWKEGLTEKNAEDIIDYDLIIDCCDNYSTRFLIDKTCQKCDKPWVYGSIGGFMGQVSVFLPDAIVRYSNLYPDTDEMSSLPAASGGVIGFVPGVVGAIEAAEAVKYLLGISDNLAGKLLHINLKTMDFNVIEF